MDLLKAFDCIPYDLLIAKLYAYGFSQNPVSFIDSRLTRSETETKSQRLPQRDPYIGIGCT